MINQVAAFKATLDMAAERNMALVPMPDESLSFEHMEDMWEKIISAEDDETPFDPGKLGRWLGWAQCCMVAGGLATLDELKALNKNFHIDETE